MTKILIHLGLPKTATTSLQHNVLQKLHEQGRINFLGKNLDYCDATGKVTVHNYTGKFIRDAAEKKISLGFAREKLIQYIDKDKLNVFSDEGLMVAYPGLHNLPLKQKIENLAELLEGYEVEIALTLRNPVDYFYSLYVQLYPDFYSQIKELNTIEKYTEKLVIENDNVLFESFFYDSYLPFLKENFKVELSYFEDLIEDKNTFYQVWADLLNLTFEEFKELFEQVHVNKKQKTGAGSKKSFSLKFIETYIRNKLKNSKFLYDSAKMFYVFFKLEAVFNKRRILNSVHAIPTGHSLNSLHRIFNVNKYERNL
ncbi:MAG: hypothetical protein ACI936_002503 [Paraglaciecola sp.]|jgi:hypothetical protein